MDASGPVGVKRMTTGSPNQQKAASVSVTSKGRRISRSVSMGKRIESSIHPLASFAIRPLDPLVSQAPSWPLGNNSENNKPGGQGRLWNQTFFSQGVYCGLAPCALY